METKNYKLLLLLLGLTAIIPLLIVLYTMSGICETVIIACLMVIIAIYFVIQLEEEEGTD